MLQDSINVYLHPLLKAKLFPVTKSVLSKELPSYFMPVFIELLSLSAAPLETGIFQASGWDRWWYPYGGPVFIHMYLLTTYVFVYMCVYLLNT